LGTLRGDAGRWVTLRDDVGRWVTLRLCERAMITLIGSGGDSLFDHLIGTRET